MSKKFDSISPPMVILIGGPNGAGKSTLAEELLPESTQFVNADVVAKELAAGGHRSSDVEAGRIVLRQLEEIEREREAFALETTLASRSLARRIERLQSSGYLFRLIYVWLPSADLSVQRVSHRVRRGGHSIPEETIRRRYLSGIRNFFHVYMPLADEWSVYANITRAGPDLIATGLHGETTNCYNKTIWERIIQMAGDE